MPIRAVRFTVPALLLILASPAFAKQNCDALAAEAVRLKAEMAEIGRQAVAASERQAATQKGMAAGALAAQGAGQIVPYGGYTAQGIAQAQSKQAAGALKQTEGRMQRMQTAYARLQEVEALSAKHCAGPKRQMAGGSADGKLTCAQIADELARLSGSVTANLTGNLARTHELMGGPNMLEQSIAGQVTAAAAAAAGPGGGAVAGIAASAQAARAEARRREAPKRQAELATLDASRTGGLDRMLELHEMHQARCAGK